MHKSIAFVGPPGSGKGSQADLLQRTQPGRFFIASTGDILREEKEHPRVIIYQQRKDRSALFPDHDMVQVFDDWLWRKATAGLYVPGEHTLIKDGFPRTVRQLDLAIRHYSTSALVYFSNVDEELSLARILGRKEKAVAAGAAVRNDDNERDGRRRYRVFVNETLPVLDEAVRIGVRVFEVDARRSIISVNYDMQKIIEGNPGYF